MEESAIVHTMRYQVQHISRHGGNDQIFKTRGNTSSDRYNLSTGRTHRSRVGLEVKTMYDHRRFANAYIVAARVDTRVQSHPYRADHTRFLDLEAKQLSNHGGPGIDSRRTVGGGRHHKMDVNQGVNETK